MSLYNCSPFVWGKKNQQKQKRCVISLGTSCDAVLSFCVDAEPRYSASILCDLD